MALVLNRSVFFHIGRTGGYSVRATLENLGLEGKEVGAFHASPAELDITTEMSSFTFVRHPLKWLRSLWYHKLLFGPEPGDHPVLHHVSDVTPERFIEYCVENFPRGIAYHYFSPFLECTYIGRLERVRDDLHKILLECGEISPDQQFSTARQNDSQHPVVKEFVASSDVLASYLRTELHWCEAYGYDNVPEEMIGAGQYLSPLANGWSNRLYRDGPSENPEVASRFRDASPFILGCASRDNLPVGEIVAYRVSSYDYDNYLRFSSHLRQRRFDPQRAYENFTIAHDLNNIDLNGKTVLQIECGDGFHAVSAERAGAKSVIAIDAQDQPFFSEFVVPFLASNIKFSRLSLAEIPPSWKGTFDVIILSKFHKLTESPVAALRSIFELLKPKARLLLDADIIDDLHGLPLIFLPSSGYSPTEGVAYMTRDALDQAIERLGATESRYSGWLRIGLDEPGRFPELAFPSLRPESIDRSSIIVKVLVDIVGPE